MLSTVLSHRAEYMQGKLLTTCPSAHSPMANRALQQHQHQPLHPLFQRVPLISAWCAWADIRWWYWALQAKTFLGETFLGGVWAMHQMHHKRWFRLLFKSFNSSVLTVRWQHYQHLELHQYNQGALAQKWRCSFLDGSLDVESWKLFYKYYYITFITCAVDFLFS